VLLNHDFWAWHNVWSNYGFVTIICHTIRADPKKILEQQRCSVSQERCSIEQQSNAGENPEYRRSHQSRNSAREVIQFNMGLVCLFVLCWGAKMRRDNHRFVPLQLESQCESHAALHRAWAEDVGTMGSEHDLNVQKLEREGNRLKKGVGGAEKRLTVSRTVLLIEPK
jgi:hypothetical protein